MNNNKNKSDGVTRTFRDPSIKIEESLPVDDPIVILCLKWWKPVLTAVAVLISAVFIKSNFRESAKRNAENSALTYERVAEDFARFNEVNLNLNDARQKKEFEKTKNIENALNDVKKRLDQQIAILRDGSKEFPNIGNFYQILALHNSGKTQEALQKISSLNIDDWKVAVDEKRFFPELAAYIKAKILLDDSATFPSGVSLLEELASEGKYLHVVSVSSLSLVSQDKEKIKSLKEKIKSNFPEQAALVDRDGKGNT